MNKSMTEKVDNYISEITETLRYVMDLYRKKRTDVYSARTYFWCVVHAYDNFEIEHQESWKKYAQELELETYGGIR